MNEAQADQLAKRIINTFRTTPPLAEWRHVLERLDVDYAVEAFEHCRDSIPDTLPIAVFLQRYNTDRRVAGGIPGPESTGPAIPPHIGKRVAWQTYVAECRGQGREPNRNWFNDTIGTTT